MLQAKFSVEKSQAEFLSKYRTYGFENKSAMLREAIERFKKEIELENLKKSADLYSENYVEDNELRDMTEAAVSGWPK